MTESFFYLKTLTLKRSDSTEPAVSNMETGEVSQDDEETFASQFGLGKSSVVQKAQASPAFFYTRAWPRRRAVGPSAQPQAFGLTAGLQPAPWTIGQNTFTQTNITWNQVVLLQHRTMQVVLLQYRTMQVIGIQRRTPDHYQTPPFLTICDVCKMK